MTALDFDVGAPPNGLVGSYLLSHVRDVHLTIFPCGVP